MKKIIQFILPALIMYTSSYSISEKDLPPVTKVITDLQALDETFHPVNLFLAPELRKVEGIGNYFHMRIDKNEMLKLYNANYQSIQLEIPLSASVTVNVLLTKHQVLADDFKAMIGSKKDHHEQPYSTGLFYYGIVENQSRSLAAITIFNNEISGVISDQHGNWNLGALDKDKNEYGYYNDHEFLIPGRFICGTKDTDPSGANKLPELKFLSTPIAHCVKVSIDCDHDFYLYKSSDFDQVVRYVLDVFNVESTLYANESITVSIAAIIVWDVQDPYDNGNSTDNLEAYSADYFSGGGGIDLFQLWAMDAGGLGGLAWLGGLCTSYIPFIIGPDSYCDISGSYTTSQLQFPTYTWDAEVSTHEMGHNLGSHHTHWCNWTGGPIDNCNTYWGSSTSGGPLSNSCSANFAYPLGTEGGCAAGPSPGSAGGTIMSYCHGCSTIGVNFANGFGPQPGNVIRNTVAGVSCLDHCNGFCLTTENVANPVYSGNTVTFKSVYYLYGSSDIKSGGNATFKSDVVILKPGFHAFSGSVFGAYPISCGTPAPQIAGPIAADEQRNSSGIDNNDAFRISPNPFQSTFDIAFDLIQNRSIKIAAFSFDGSFVKEWPKKSIPKGTNTLSLDCTGWSAGVYYLNIYIDDTKIVKRIVKM